MTRSQIEELYKNSFMKPEIIEDAAYIVETNNGTEIVPFHLVGEVTNKEVLLDYLEDAFEVDDILEIELQDGYVYRLSASGYTDSTSWGFDKSFKDILVYFESMAEGYE